MSSAVDRADRAGHPAEFGAEPVAQQVEVEADQTVASAEPERRARLDFVDGIRALAALYVVLHHMWLTVYPAYPDYQGPALLGWLAYGQLAVSVFIVVSGFSLSIAPARRDWRLTQGLRTYLRRRAWRILPTYWAALLFSCIVFGLITADVTGDKVSGKGVLVHALLLQDVIGSPSPNGAFWSIAVEWQIYFLFPLFLLIRRRWGLGSLLASVSAVIVLSYLLATSQPAFERLLNLTPQFVILFVFGMAAGEGVRRKIWRRPELGLPAAGLLLVGLVAVLVTQDLFWVEREYFWVDLLAGAATAVLLWSLAIGRGAGLGRVLASRPLAGTGGFSYSIYCMHLPLMWLVWHFALAPLELSPLGGLALLFAVALPVVLVGSYVFSQVFEQPFLRHRSFRELGNGFLRREKSRMDGAVTPSR